MFQAHVLIIRRAKLYYTASGIITLIGGRPVHATAPYRSDDTRCCIIQCRPPDDEHMVLETCPVHRLRQDWFNQSSLNLCTGRPPTGVMIPDAV